MTATRLPPTVTGTVTNGAVLWNGTSWVNSLIPSDTGIQPTTNNGTTKTTPGSVDKWMLLTVGGTTYYTPLYLSKTA